jgi:hypothetical protein
MLQRQYAVEHASQSARGMHARSTCRVITARRGGVVLSQRNLPPLPMDAEARAHTTPVHTARAHRTSESVHDSAHALDTAHARSAIAVPVAPPAHSTALVDAATYDAMMLLERSARTRRPVTRLTVPVCVCLCSMRVECVWRRKHTCNVCRVVVCPRRLINDRIRCHVRK